MNIWDILIIVIIAGAVFAALKKRRKGSCSCGCADCPSAGFCGKKEKDLKENGKQENI